MSSRYHIEDLVSQDESGAVFRATDLETGGEVAIRRFFPAGGAGAGFLEAEVEGYLKTVEALKQAVHESLLPVVDGGVDEVDGVPFLVMQWAEGRPLSEHLAERPLDAEATVAMVARGLEGLMVLEQMFGREARWLEMETTAVVVTPGVPDFRFWICPFQWLGVADRDGGVRGLGFLAELAMGWDGQVVPLGAAAGLGGWVAQAKKGGWPLDEAFAALVRVRSFWTGEELSPVMPASPAEVVPVPAAPGTVAAGVAGGGMGAGVVPPPGGLVTETKSKGPVVFIVGIVAACLMLGGLVWTLLAQPWLGDERKKTAKNETSAKAPATPDGDSVPAPAARKRAMTPQEIVDERLRKIQESGVTGGGVDPEGTATASDDPVEFDGDLRVFTWEDGEALRSWVGTTVILEGPLLRVRDSRSGKTRYLEFQDSKGMNDVCGYFTQSNRFGKDLDALKALEGKKISCKGEVMIEVGTGRVVVDIKAPPEPVAED